MSGDRFFLDTNVLVCANGLTTGLGFLQARFHAPAAVARSMSTGKPGIRANQLARQAVSPGDIGLLDSPS
jgi:hypothetical protein